MISFSKCILWKYSNGSINLCKSQALYMKQRYTIHCQDRNNWSGEEAFSPATCRFNVLLVLFVPCPCCCRSRWHTRHYYRYTNHHLNCLTTTQCSGRQSPTWVTWNWPDHQLYCPLDFHLLRLLCSGGFAFTRDSWPPTHNTTSEQQPIGLELHFITIFILLLLTVIERNHNIFIVDLPDQKFYCC